MKFNVREPNRQRFLDALHRRESLEISYYDTEFSPSIVSAILGKQINDRSYALPIHDYIEFVQRVGLDVCQLVMPWWLGRENYVDERGMVRYKTGSMRTRADLRHIDRPDVDFAKRRIEGFLDAAADTRLGWVIGLPTAAGIIVTAMGFEHYYTCVRDDPGFIEEFLDRVEEHIFPATQAVLAYRPDAANIGAFICFKTGLSMSPELTERFVFRPLERHVGLFRAKNVPVIIHSDGDNTEVMERLIEIGFSGFHPVEPSERYDIYEYKARWGDRIALCGNIDCGGVLSRGTPDEVARDTLEHLQRLSGGGGYICGSSHDVGDNVPIDNLRAMVETVAEYRHRIGGSLWNDQKT